MLIVPAKIRSGPQLRDIGEPVERRDCESALEKRIGYHFIDAALLREALTHKSYSNEQPGREVPYNERLEFLGDAVLDLVVSDLIFRAFRAVTEGELTRIRAEVVSERKLAEVGRQLGMGGCLLLGRGEDRSGGREKDSLVADGLEALIGAIFCDGGLAPASSVIETLFTPCIGESAGRKTGTDYKTRLQELLQGRCGRPPLYALLAAEGPDHDRMYTVEVLSDGVAIGRGRGRTKKAAEQEAAREALGRLEG